MPELPPTAAPDAADRAPLARTPRPLRRPLVALAIALAALAGLAGCGSDEPEQKGTRTGNEVQEVRDPQDSGATDESFCAAVDDVREAEAAGDTTAMADALQLLLDDLPDEVADDVQTYIDGLTAAPPNDRPEPDSVENDEAGKAFDSYAEERCGGSADS